MGVCVWVQAWFKELGTMQGQPEPKRGPGRPKLLQGVYEGKTGYNLSAEQHAAISVSFAVGDVVILLRCITT